MEITTCTRSDVHLASVPRTPPAKPSREPTYATDEECARLLEDVLRDVPTDLVPDRRSQFPQLDALIKFDSARNTDTAKQLVFIAAVNHRTADERRTAEYLLRHRGAIASGRRSARSLLLAARCSAEMDVRRIQLREAPVPRETLTEMAIDRPVIREDDPSVGEMVLDKLRMVIGYRPLSTDRIRDAVSIALELAERHGLNRGRGPSLVAMRTNVRKDSRLVTHLRAEFGNDVAARSVARLLVGADGAPIENALLWWSACPDLTAANVPLAIRSRWTRYVRGADAALIPSSRLPGASQSYPQARAC